MFWALAFPIVAFVTGFENAPYVGIVCFGLISSVIWGEENYTYTIQLLETIWIFAQIFLFVTVGAVLILSKVQPSKIPYSFIIFVVAMIVKMASAFTMVGGKGLTVKERILVTFCMIPKAAT